MIPERFKLVFMSFLAIFICYIDRVNISVAIIPMQQQFGWSEAQVGIRIGCDATSETLFHSCPEGRQFTICTIHLGTRGVILILRNSNCSQNTDDRHNDHQFDQGKTLLTMIHFDFLHVIDL